MKISKSFIKTLREAPGNETASSAQLLIRAGYISKELAGVYDFMPLGRIVLEKIKNIIRNELNRIGCEEIQLSSLQNPELWKATDRWDDQKVDIWFKTALSAGGELGLAPTHEEPVTNLMKNYVKSYKDLPAAVYQFQTKFRNELRAKSGILRTREFLMKDLYSFHANEEDLDNFYHQVENAYDNIYRKLGIGDDTHETFASGGVFSKYSHEYQTFTPVGEDTVWHTADYSICLNDEVMQDDVLDDLGVKREDLIPDRAAEVGNIFKLKTKYSAPLGLEYTDSDNQKKPVIMGCYGIGVTRVMGVIAEKYADDRGLVWPENIAPYKYYLVSIGESAENKASELYAGHEDVFMFDDRKNIRYGEKMGDFELLGIPYCVIISDKTLANNQVELIERKTGDKKILTIEEFTARL